MMMPAQDGTSHSGAGIVKTYIAESRYENRYDYEAGRDINMDNIIQQKELKLVRISDRIWYSEYDEERDRPCLGYVRGSSWSLAVDAGHSGRHVEEFYSALEREKLPLPSITVITHWHWDHAFGMHSVSGLSAANVRTDSYLRHFTKKLEDEGEEAFFSLDPSIRREYSEAPGSDRTLPVIIKPADITFDGEMTLRMGDISAKLITSISPHTDDSTLVYIPEERFLFVGDSICGRFPTWDKDPEKAGILARTIEQVDVDLCLGGHWPVMNKHVLIDFLNSWE